jgi:hypothetical protein
MNGRNLALPVLLFLALPLSGCDSAMDVVTGLIPNKGHPGDQTVCYVACRELSTDRPIRLSDVAEVKRADFQTTNDFHLVRDFIGRTPRFPIERGKTIDDTKIDSPPKQLFKKDREIRSDVDPAEFSQSVPVLRATEDIPRGGVACEDNLKQVMVRYSEVPFEVITEKQEFGGRPAHAFLAKETIPRDTIVTYKHIVDNSTESNMRHFIATRDLPAGAVLMPPDLVAILDEHEMSQRIAATLDGNRKDEERLHEGTYDFSNWFECRLTKPLKKGDPLTDEALGPVMTKVAFAAHDLKPGVALKKSDVIMTYIEESKMNPQKDFAFLENAVGVVPKTLIKSGTKIVEDDIEHPEVERQ